MQQLFLSSLQVQQRNVRKPLTEEIEIDEELAIIPDVPYLSAADKQAIYARVLEFKDQAELNGHLYTPEAEALLLAEMLRRPQDFLN